jgi:aryl-alcohol dehydrogenase-like predicted oxidoreductase
MHRAKDAYPYRAAAAAAVISVQAWRVSERLGLIGPACEQPEYNMFARKKVEQEFKPIYER